MVRARSRGVRRAAFQFAPVVAAVLAACGGDGGGGGGAAPASVLNGTAAVGAALASATVSITDVSKASVCVETTIVTTATGSYTCTLLSGKTAPFLVVVTDPSGAHAPLVSVASTTPTPGTPLVVNATPLTTAIVAQLAPSKDPLALVSDPTLLDTAKLASVTSKVLAQIAPALSVLGAPAGYDPFSTQIVAANTTQGGNTADQVIETLSITTVDGVTKIATVDNPDAAVPLADATTSSPPALPAPSTAVVTLSESMRLLSNALGKCFALPVATRVVARNDAVPAAEGGPEVTEVAPDCELIVHPDYRHNGYWAGQQFYGLLLDGDMVGATFTPPELMRFIDDTSTADNDRAVLNLRYVDKNGNAGNIITVAKKLPGTSTTTRPTDWWLYGNQQLVDVGVRAFVRRNEQLAPSPGTAPFANASTSRFESGIELFVNKDGPGSTGLRAARFTGPGLPTRGVVLTPPDPAVCTDQTWFNIRRKDGLTDAASATPASIAGNIFRLQRTVGLTGTDATTVRPNPNAANGNSTAFPDWAHPLDYGAVVGATGYIDFSQLRANTTYTVELFYEGETTPRYTYDKTMLTSVIPSTRGAGLQWIDLTAATKGYLDPANALGGAQTSISLAWLANPFAETIRSAGVYTFGGGVQVNQGIVGVVRGATSATANAPGNNGTCTAGSSFPALTSDGTSSRSLQLRYRMLDGGYKDSFTRFN